MDGHELKHWPLDKYLRVVFVMQDVQFEVVIEQVRQDGAQAVQVPLIGIIDMLEQELWQVPLFSTSPAVHDVQFEILPWQVRQLILQLSHVLAVLLATVELIGQLVLHTLLYKKYPVEHLVHEVPEAHKSHPVVQLTQTLPPLIELPYVPLGHPVRQLLLLRYR